MVVYLLLGLAIGCIVVFLLLYPKLKQTQQADKEIEQRNLLLSNNVNELEIKKSNLLNELDRLQMTTESIYAEKERVLKEKFEENAERLALIYRTEEEKYKDEYLNTLEESARYYKEQLGERREELLVVTNTLKELKSKADAATAVYKRTLEEEQKIDFYRLELTEIDIKEINKIREVEQYLRDARPISKVIWTVYYEHPYTDLIGRVIGHEQKTGIYKITNLVNHMCYVGQAANIAERWKQHIKCAIGAEDGARNKLYPAMQKYGVENFTFEIIEECSREELNEREQYWQDFYKAKEFGYSIH